MKKRICILVMAAAMLLTGCEATNAPTPKTDKTRTVIIRLANDEIVTGTCEFVYWHSNDSVEVKMDGITYITHSSNVTEIIEYK